MARHTRLRNTRTKPVSAPVTVVRRGVDSLHPKVRKVALRLAHGDVMRVEVVDEETAIVR